MDDIYGDSDLSGGLDPSKKEQFLLWEKEMRKLAPRQRTEFFDDDDVDSAVAPAMLAEQIRVMNAELEANKQERRSLREEQAAVRKTLKTVYRLEKIRLEHMSDEDRRLAEEIDRE